jgi:hypothetical protein
VHPNVELDLADGAAPDSDAGARPVGVATDAAPIAHQLAVGVSTEVQ